MVTQTLAFFPAPTVGMGNGTAPIAMGDGTMPQAMPFANALTQAQTQTQAGMNPLVLALLNGLAGMPTITSNMPVVPNLGEATVTEEPTAAETVTSRTRDSMPGNANLTSAGDGGTQP